MDKVMKQFENIIFEALAIDDNSSTSASLASIAKGYKVSDIYLKNALVSLASIKQHNHDVCVALVVNIELEEYWKKRFEQFGITLFYCPYDTFVVPKHIVYSLSYYKLCAFDYLVKKTDYERYCFVDCDTFSINSYKPLWKECDSAINIVPNESSITSKKRVEINKIYNEISNENKLINHYCSSFIAGTKSDLVSLLGLCRQKYEKLFVDDSVLTEIGDEIIWSLALADYDGRIHSPKAYCLLSFITATNYWIDKEHWDDENVFMWHLPGDKRYSLIWAYDYLMNEGSLPSKKKMASASRFRHVKTIFSLLAIRSILKDGSAIKRNIRKLFKRN